MDAFCTAANPTEKRTQLAQIIRAATAQEQNWLVRIVLKDMKIGLRHERVLKELHPEALNIFNRCSDLKLVMASIRSGKPLGSFLSSIQNSSSNPFLPSENNNTSDNEGDVNEDIFNALVPFGFAIRPMLAERLLIEEVEFRLFPESYLHHQQVLSMEESSCQPGSRNRTPKKQKRMYLNNNNPAANEQNPVIDNKSVIIATPWRVDNSQGSSPSPTKKISCDNQLRPRDYIIETKLDGERLIAHVDSLKPSWDAGGIKLFSRNGVNVTHLYGPKLGETLMKSVKAKKVVLDGELMALDTLTGQFLPFGHNKTIAKNGHHVGNGACNRIFDGESSADNNNARAANSLASLPSSVLCFVAFDILSFTSYSNQFIDAARAPLSSRLALLERTVCSTNLNVLAISKHQICSSPDDIKKALDEASRACAEGIMVKDVNSMYLLGARQKSGWFKLKPSFGTLGDCLDLVCIGAYLSDGVRRRELGGDAIYAISHFLLGLLVTDPNFQPIEGEDEESANKKKYRVVPFCKVGTGYSLTELSFIRARQKANAVRFLKKDSYNTQAYETLVNDDIKWKALSPSNDAEDGNACGTVIAGSSCSKKLLVGSSWRPEVGERPDFVWPLHEGFICQVHAAEFIPTTSFPSNMTLRFPRCQVLYRDDKNWYEGLSIEDALDWSSGLEKKKRIAHDFEDEEDGVKREMANDHAAKTEHSNTFSQGIISKRKRKSLQCASLLSNKMTLAKDFQVASKSDVQVQSSFLKGWKILILSGDEKLSKLDVEILCSSLGASVLQSFPSKENTRNSVIIAGAPTARSKSVSQYYSLPVWSIEWLTSSIQSGHVHFLKAADEHLSTDPSSSTMIPPNFIIEDHESLPGFHLRRPDMFGDPHRIDTNLTLLSSLIAPYLVHSATSPPRHSTTSSSLVNAKPIPTDMHQKLPLILHAPVILPEKSNLSSLHLAGRQVYVLEPRHALTLMENADNYPFIKLLAAAWFQRSPEVKESTSIFDSVNDFTSLPLEHQEFDALEKKSLLLRLSMIGSTISSDWNGITPRPAGCSREDSESNTVDMIVVSRCSELFRFADKSWGALMSLWNLVDHCGDSAFFVFRKNSS